VSCDMDRQVEALCDGAVDVFSREELAERIKLAAAENRPLRVKYGADPSAPDIHLGHSVPLRKLRRFQDFGHEVIVIIGDFTGMIGDPSGKSKTRPALTREQVEANARTYFDQVGRIIDVSRARVVYNSEWLSPMSFADVIRLAAKYTVARMLERDDFAQRIAAGQPVSVHEFLYPLAQAYDSVALEADVEIGGTDQTFNFLATRDIMSSYGQAPQVVITLPLLVGTDGVQKMSKSLGNYVGILDEPSDMFGKVMSVPDAVMWDYFRLVTDVPESDVRDMTARVTSGDLNPRDAKARLAREIVTLYHDAGAATAAEAEFARVFSSGGLPDEIPECVFGPDDLEGGLLWVVRMVSAAAGCSSSEARRLIVQGAVSIDGEAVSSIDDRISPKPGAVLRVGKRRFYRLKLSD